MAITQIDSTRPNNYYRSVIGLGASGLSFDYGFSWSGKVEPSGEYLRLNRAYPAFTNSSGALIDSVGVVLFDSATAGASLHNVTVVNRGLTENVYIGINQDNIHINSGFMLNSGESFGISESVVTRIWAITQANTTSVSFIGTQRI